MASGARPALPGGHELGDQLYYTGSSQTFESGNKLTHGQSGEAQPRGAAASAGRSRDRRPYWTGSSHSFESGDTLTHGQQGEVVGPATGAHQGNGLQVLFPGNKGSINCYLPQLSLEKPPPLPGGHELGDQLYYAGSNQTFESGDKLVHGQSGEVVGPATDFHQGNGLQMLFPGNKGHVDCYLPQLSREKPPPLPGGHELGDQLYWTGSSHSFESGNKLTHGQQGEVVGPATGEHQGNGLKMRFPGNKDSINCSLLRLSREKPPPLPGGHEPGDQLYYAGSNQSFKSGNKLVHGQQGEVVGPATCEHQGNGLKMRFPGNKDSINCALPQLSIEKPPPFPGGHEIGDRLYWTGSNQSFESGDTIVHGQQGEVVGPATGEHQGNGLQLLFPGNKGWIECGLASLSHELSLPGGFRVGEELYFIGGGFVDEQGDKAVFGCRGSVTGPARNGDADAVSMSFSGNRGDVHCRAEELSREPAPSLPGGFVLGEHLYFTGEDQIVGRGILVRGSRGEVVGLGLEPDSLAMRFSNKVLFSGNQPVNIASLSRDDPCAVSSVPENVLRARRALAARREEQERAAAAAASQTAEDIAAEAERRQQLAAELLEEEAAARAPPPLQEAGRRRRRKKKQSGFRGSKSSATEGAEGSADCGDSTTSRAAPARESASESDEEERVTPAEEARRAEESERAAQRERQARLLEAARREREERLEREARAEAAAAAAAESEARGRRQQAARAAEEERKRAARAALVDEMEAQARQEEAARAGAQLRTTQAEQSSTRSAIEQALSQARSDAAAARVREATAGSEAERARSEAERARLEAEAARAREQEARGRKEAATAEAEAATAREEALTMRLAALELGPPPAAPPPATANNAVGGGVGGTFHGATLPQKVSRICAHLGLDARSSLSAAVAAANESTGVAAEGGLLQQVDRLIALLFWEPQGSAPEVR
ncbi:hypothetical protein EMIHUDRAFT_101881 [Emiliania huxleyi CCMP1516]|uniref:Uncharacterized protein n=2 Tax=Emiliania huxleyi TaxID=2903 RepID=A0A0D3JAL5_EMIH1|nr:hypothetical protein EMIHUDRAFT_101881 [Emiliania huxleyi CCMP1516]EOD20550.1 hypothetical protein EMIHUDRAFT_101881 [Emiliania huxleyi CCMP1516]|eukprot:XP_005772979.1 hypothetical protein EMIHUDRAFT_101881 [Emiliania huxleyi CCMP1516]